eukprot:6044977-Pleurochrysis_carterae.AAC.1
MQQYAAAQLSAARCGCLAECSEIRALSPFSCCFSHACASTFLTMRPCPSLVAMRQDDSWEPNCERARQVSPPTSVFARRSSQKAAGASSAVVAAALRRSFEARVERYSSDVARPSSFCGSRASVPLPCTHHHRPMSAPLPDFRARP